MSGDLSRQNWLMLAVTAPFIVGLTHLALNSVRSEQPAASDTRDVSFKVVFDERVNFPQTIRQSTIVGLLGPEYQIVSQRSAAEQSAGECRDCQIQRHGGLLTVRVPQSASSAEVAGRLEQLSRVKSVTIYMKN